MEHLELLEIIREKEPSNYWISLGKICRSDYWAYLRLILRLRFLDPFWHGEEICRFLEMTRGQDRIIMLPREAGKTTCITVPFPSWCIANQPLILCQITNVGEDKANAYAKASAEIISKNVRFQWAYPHIQPSKEKWSGLRGYDIDRRIAVGGEEGSFERIDPTLKGIGVRGNITGAHVGLQIHDDLIGLQNYRSQTEMTRVEDFLKEAKRCCMASGIVLVVCTRWTYRDVYGKIEAGDFQFHKGPFAVLKRGVYKEDGSLIWPQTKYFDISGNPFEAGYTEQQIENEKKDPLFSALYLNEPKLNENEDFDLNLIGRYEQLPFDIAGVHSVYIEAEGQAKGLPHTVRQLMREEHRHFSINSFTNPREVDKDTRIRGLLGPIISESHLHMEEIHYRGALGDQMRQFPKGFKDLVDALASSTKFAREPAPGELPKAVIVVDPAFSLDQDLDQTGIIGICKYKGDFWILEVRAIRTEKPEIIARNIFRMYDKLNQRAFDIKRKEPSSYKPFRSTGVRSHGRQRWGRTSHNFTCDLPGFTDREKERPL